MDFPRSFQSRKEFEDYLGCVERLKVGDKVKFYAKFNVNKTIVPSLQISSLISDEIDIVAISDACANTYYGEKRAFMAGGSIKSLPFGWSYHGNVIDQLGGKLTIMPDFHKKYSKFYFLWHDDIRIASINRSKLRQ